VECHAGTLPRDETRWNLQGCPKLPNRSQAFVDRSSPYYQDVGLLFNKFFSDCRYMPYLRRYSPTKLCDGAEMAIFCILYFQQATCSTFQTCNKRLLRLGEEKKKEERRRTTTNTTQPFYNPFPGPYGWAGAWRELLVFLVQGKINRGRHTDHLAGRHSIRTNHCPPPPSLHIFYRLDALPAAQPTVSKHWRQLKKEEETGQKYNVRICYAGRP